MAIAVLNDIHGNLPALEAVLEELATLSIDALVIGGDVLPGPMPRETLTTLFNLNLPVHCLHGNGDREVLDQRRGLPAEHLPPHIREVAYWTAEQLTPDDVTAVAAWPGTVRLTLRPLGEVLFCHASPRNDQDIFTRLTPEENVLPYFAGVDVPLVICGHTHMQFDRRIGDIRVVNAGSVGMPFGEPGAYWLLLDDDINFRRTPYDLEAAARRVRATRYPMAELFAAGNILSPPTAAEALAKFT